MEKMDKNEISLAELFGIAIKRIWIIIAAMIIGGLAALYYTSFLVTPMYQSVSKYLVDTTNLAVGSNYYASTTASVEEQRNTVLSRLIVSSYIEILQTHNFSEYLALMLEGNTNLSRSYTPDELLSMVTYAFVEEKEFYTVTVKAPDPADAFIIARCIEENSEEYLTTKKSSAKGTIKIIDNARTNEVPVNVRYVLNILIGALTCALIAFGIVFVVETNDVRIKNEKELISAVGLPVIGAIPEQTLYRDKPNSYKKSQPAARKNGDYNA